VENHGDAVLGQEFSDTQGRVAWRIVMVQKPGTGRLFVRPFPTNCILKALQNGQIDSLIYGLALGEIRDAPDPPHQRKRSTLSSHLTGLATLSSTEVTTVSSIVTTFVLSQCRSHKPMIHPL
jgi:hypothetical protein